jgi:hypothetical protein
VSKQALHSFAVAAAALTFLGGTPADAQTAAPTATATAPQASPLDGAERIGSGRLSAWRKGPQTLVVLPPDALGKPLLWYTEVVAVPSGMVANNGLEVNNATARFERVGGVVHVRDLSTVVKRRAGRPAGDAPPSPLPAGVPGASPDDVKVPPIEVALGATETGAVIASFPIVGTQPDGSLVVDVTATFSNDIPSATGRLFIASGGLLPLQVDPSKSYIDRVRVRGDALNVRSHLTFLSTLPAVPQVGPQPVSIVLGHSIVFLPDKPMAGRPADPRVGFFPVEYTQFEADRGTAQDRRVLIQRFRLEKKDPTAAVSDPVKPITFVLGRGIPDRWKPYVAAGVLQWLPAFAAAGFSNAIRVVDAPTLEQDPDWTPEDVTINVIRWLPQERLNAMGPRVVDPRSGEALSAHIQVWPQVIDGFGQYYYAMFGGGVDPEAQRLPLSTEKAGALLSYIVAHEIGHTLGLMHNHIASTAYPVAQMRNPAFANRFGPNSSIMAYGRFNQAAQPGDGVTQLWGVIGPYDMAAIRYGYGTFGTDAASEARELAAFADTFAKDRRLYWGTEERGDFIGRFGRDPRVQMENTGAERVEATRLGVANLQRSLARLDAATGDDDKLFAATYDAILARHVGLLKSVNRLIAGAMPPLGAGEGPTARIVPAAEQRQAVQYLLGEGAASLDPYAAPAIVERVVVFGGYRAIDRLQASLVGDVLNGSNVAMLESQRRRDPQAYWSLDLGRDVTVAVWGDLKVAPPPRRALQRGYIDAAQKMLDAWAKGPAAEANEEARAKLLMSATERLPPAAARAAVESGDDTVFVPWLRAELPELHKRLEAASRMAPTEADRLHFADMATQVARLQRVGAP